MNKYKRMHRSKTIMYIITKWLGRESNLGNWIRILKIIINLIFLILLKKIVKTLTEFSESQRMI
jgi:hypothetical protein